MKKIFFIVLSIILVSLSGACTPKPASTPASQVPQATPTISATSPPASSSISPNAEWLKVVDKAKKEGTVTIYSFYYVGDIAKALARAFSDRYGIRVEILASPGRQTVEKVKVEHAVKQPIADLVNTGVSSATEVSVSGLGANIWQELPNLKDKSVFLIDPVYSPNGDMIFVSLTIVAPMINTKLVKPQDEPRSFKDLLDPKWKGNILSVDPRGGGGGMFNVITTMKYFKLLDDDYWKKMASQIQLFGGSQQEQYRMVGRGEYMMALPASDSAVAPIIAEGAPLKFLPMDEGDVGQGESIIVLKDAPHPNAAKLFVDWLLSLEGQEVYAKAASTNTLRKGLKSYMLPEAMVNSKKVISRTWEAAEAGNDYQKAGLMEQLFGKK